MLVAERGLPSLKLVLVTLIGGTLAAASLADAAILF